MFHARTFQFLATLCLEMMLNSFLNKTAENTATSKENVSSVSLQNQSVFLPYSVAPNYPQEFLIYLQKLQTPSLIVDVVFICNVK